MIPNLGLINGETGTDFQLQIDGNSSFNTGIPMIHIAKQTNGTAPTPTGPLVAVGSTVTFTYLVTNTGNVPLPAWWLPTTTARRATRPTTSIATFVGGDANGNGLLDPTETWTYTATAAATAGQYDQHGHRHRHATAGGPPVTSTDLDNYFGVTPGINLVKLTNGTTTTRRTGPIVPVGSTVTFTYIVTNTGNVPLSGVVVTDDNGTPGNPADDFNRHVHRRRHQRQRPARPDETWTYTATRIATAGQYTNTATATGQDVLGRPQHRSR